MSLCASRSPSAAARVLPLAVVALISATTLGFEPSALAQTTPAPAAPKKDEPKKGDPKKPADPAPAAPPAPGATAAADAKPADPAAATEKAPDDHRAIYLSADIGFSRADVGGLSDDTGFDKTAANGFLAGIGIGYRYKDLRIGGRFRTTSTSAFSLWSLMGEIGYGLPFRPVSPIFFAHAGYMFDVGVDREVIASALPRGNIQHPDVDLNGLVIGGELTAAYWLSKVARVGPFVGLDFTFLRRPMVGQPQSLFPLSDQTKQNPLFSDSGAGAGYIISFGLRGTADIAF